MIDLRSEKSFIYRLVLPIIQVLGFIFLLLSEFLSNKVENISDMLMLRNITIATMSLALIISGTRELIIRKNKFYAYLYFGFIFVTTTLIIRLYVIYRVWRDCRKMWSNNFL